ncbi:MAG: nucleoid DNA-binding protein, partial [Bradymonadia bacterium]
AREGRSPATGEKIMIKAKKHAKFKPGKTLRDRVAE